jgi:hypothetical protein
MNQIINKVIPEHLIIFLLLLALFKVGYKTLPDADKVQNKVLLRKGDVKMAQSEIQLVSENDNITFGLEGQPNVLKITKDGFYIRGKKVPQNEDEAKIVYDAFVAWLKKANYTKP